MRQSLLVVEHDRATAVALAARLRGEGYDVRLADAVGETGRALLAGAVKDADRVLLAGAVGDADRPVPRVAGLCVDVAARAVTLHGRPLRLRRLEYELLLALAREPRRVLTKRELMRLVWGHDGSLRTRTLASHASRLRRRLAAAEDVDATAADVGQWIVNVRGVGYRLR